MSIKETRTIKEVRHLYPDRLRSLCIRENFYTNGTNDEYIKLFEMIPERHENVSALDIYNLACNIQAHSKERNDCSKEEYLEHIMFLIGDVCVTLFEVCVDYEYIND